MNLHKKIDNTEIISSDTINKENTLLIITTPFV